ncbi:MAG: glycoside hydrolase family 25 [Lachnospiraceae bacterium]|nr:glycoside hydrolase family 25 [Lachnospiraceae bacterium]
MKKLSDLVDDLLDLDDESDDYDDEIDRSYEEDYDEEDYDEEDYDEDDEDYALPAAKLIIPIAAAASVILIVIIVVIVMTGRTTKKILEPAVETDGMSAQLIQDQEFEDEKDVELEAVEDEEPEDNITDVVKNPDDAEEDEPEDSDDPQSESMSTEQGTEVDVSVLLSSGRVTETDQVTIGIDVARYQGTIDWAQVAASGIDFAMVRVGYRADASREICADTNAKYNMQEAQKNGIKVGVYFFSTATSVEEAKAEADWVADYISRYQITYPVAYDCEGFDKPDSAQYHLTNKERTDIAIAFLQEIYSRDYTPMFYASMGELSGNAKWDTSRIESTYRIWVSQYPATPYPETTQSSYSGKHAMWQYTNRGTVAGISRPVDVNVAYFGYEDTAEAVNPEVPEEVRPDVEALMSFREVDETVTAKDSTNLRDIPSQGDDSTIVYTLKNGETVTRTGVSDSGWSRLILNGQTVYAVSSYLTTDLQYQPPVSEQEGAGSGDGLKTKFADRNESVTAKIEVNLRALPSVTNPDATVVAVLHNGEYVTRTGINEDYGWSRVDYNGQTLYCISSYLTY